MGISCVSGAAAAADIGIPPFDAWQAAQVPDEDPDALYRDRETLASATRAADVWAARLSANPGDFESAWKLARARYWLGTNGLPQAQRRAALEQGIVAGRAAAAREPKRPEGHFWMAANMGALAESFGLRQGVKYRKPIKEALETVLALDPVFLQGSADRALGRWYFKVPGLFGGSTTRSEEHLRKALTASSPASSWPRRWRPRESGTRHARSCAPRSMRHWIRTGRRKTGATSSRPRRC